MRAAREMLAQAGLDMSRYHEESSFDEQATAPAPEPRATSTGSSYTVRFERSQRSLGCAADQTVLDAARAAGCGCRPRARKACAAPARSDCCPERSTCAIRAASGNGNRPGHGAALQPPLSDLIIEK